MREGDIILYNLVQADGHIKKRPALVLRTMPPFNDLLVCGISTQMRQIVANFDEVIDKNDIHFTQTGLVTTSLVRLGFLGLVPLRDIEGVIGKVPAEFHERLLKRLASYLIQNI